MATAPQTRDRQIGDILVDQGVITPLELDEALQRQRLTGEMLGRVLVSMGLCEEQDIVEALGVQSGMERVDLTKIKVKEEVLSRMSGDVARFYNVVPIRELEGGGIMVAMANPLNVSHLDDLSHILGCEVRGAVSNMADVAESLKQNYAHETESIQETLADLVERVGDAELTAEELGQQEIIKDADNLIELAQEPEVIKIVNLVLLEAVKKRASDIHFEIYEEQFRVRIRVDGLLQEIVSPPKNLALAIISRVKVMCNMDISERRLPQDARIELKIGDSEVDIRVATLPTLFGECVVMRILDRTSVQIELTKLGFSKRILRLIDDTIHKPNGIFLVTGPTGSGKTTSLYACLKELNKVSEKIITVEDPVELQFERIVQVQVKEDIGLTFASSLRAILRQDPDIVMVGEIRDLDTAQIAIEASLTGHLVLSTLHTNSAPETLTRLLDMDVEPFMITASLEAVMAQRLVRKLCSHCKQTYKPEQDELDQLGVPLEWRRDPEFKLWRPKGCPACDFKGYLGRTGLYEMLIVDETLREMILDRAMAMEIREYARRKQGMLTLREEGLIKCAQGVSSAEEVIAHTDKYDDVRKEKEEARQDA